MPSAFRNFPHVRQAIAGAAVSGALAAGLLVMAPAAQAADVGCPTASVSLSGDGTSTSPYLIQSKEDLQLVKTAIPSAGATYLQTSDVDMQATPGTNCVWDRGIATLSGTYDGGGFEVSGLNIETSTQIRAGLFEEVTGVVKDLGYVGNVTHTRTSGSAFYVGALVGELNGGSVQNSYATGTVTSAYSEGNYSATGGLVGVGSSGAGITGSYATGRVTSISTSGGLIGRANASMSIVESYATGDVEATARLGNAGGLAGRLLSTTVTRSFATGDVSGVADVQHLGGLTSAMQSSTITDSFATGGVSGWTQSNSSYGQVGGIVGDTTGGNNTITRAYTATTSGMAPSSGADFAQVGGVAGVVATTTWNSVAWNSQTAPLVLNPIGGASSVPGVTSFTTSELTDITTFTDPAPAGLDWNTGGATTIAEGYDATYTWGICSAVNGGYPFLTAFYSSDPCSGSPSPSVGGSSAPPMTFRYFLPDGSECTAISPEVVVNHTEVIIPSADANCRTRGATLAGWTIPNQPWAFTPGYTVYVVASQRFTAILNESTATVILDANVEAQDSCVASIDGADSDLPLRDRSEDLYLDRPDMSWYAPGDRPSLEVHPAPDSAPCTPPGYELVGWNTRGDGSGTTVAIGDPFGPAINEDDPNSDRNRVRFYAVWEQTAA